MLRNNRAIASPPQFHPTRYWHRLADGRVQCDLCPRHCQLREGKRGACFVRANHQNKIVLTSYGRSSGFCIDPIEKKPLNHFLPGTSVLSFGTAGCNLSCEFCQNWNISKSRQWDTLADAAMPEALASTAKRLGCASVAFTYNDPVIFLEYAVDTAIACHELGVRSVAVSAGYIDPAPRKAFFHHMDAANIDLKAFSERFYRKICHGHLADVLDTLLYLKHETQVWLEITTLLIPGENDDPQETQAMCRWLIDNLGPNVPLHFSAFHPDFHMMDKPRTPKATLLRARRIAQEAGLNYVYVGNVHDPASDSTWCPHCGSLLIGRDWYQLTHWHLDGGRCPKCDTLVDGVFDAEPGHFGRQRIPFRISP
ncbi:AmmeMemoRadiSam system radical SAM enzyme [Ferrimonas sp. SCSIO 43195]|uniref:AmmeMemoRadiSam system radical SAM enzyme n=1 Tax=Ferrimonas sp. SCSIO 43195 TaxID=2822844 RepID=UPI002074FD0E|nr:AmmeMemoRadiSam system radical SAM enzyme [Ferrimonas sp. SCSIO 43195]USD39293.1 AmmeMemoRadiSam system radical SAM enzyme [Ferrimonas sp. SCSIO 43195]